MARITDNTIGYADGARLRGGLVLVVILVALLGMATTPYAVGGQIVVVLSNNALPYKQAQQALESTLAKQGHTSRVVMLEQFSRDPKSKTTESIDAIVAVGTKAAVWLNKNIDSNAKLTYCMVADPVGAGLKGDTPVRGISTDVPVKAQFELIAEALPHVRSVGMLYRSKTSKGKRMLKAAKDALPKGWRLEAVATDKYNSVAKAIDALFAREIDIVWTSPDAKIYNVAMVRSLLLAGLRRKKPVFGFSPAFVRAGAMLGIGIDPATQGVSAAGLTDRFLGQDRKPDPKESGSHGETTSKPGQEEVKFDIAVNLIVAKKVSVDIPEKIIERARYVFRPETDRKGGKNK
ncbi:MAG: ABC transporter substrate binding protein [Planctomycetota bacterium]|nr:ABC transporter substrate binding protein [Planctomycetota bacterium]